MPFINAKITMKIFNIKITFYLKTVNYDSMKTSNQRQYH